MDVRVREKLHHLEGVLPDQQLLRTPWRRPAAEDAGQKFTLLGQPGLESPPPGQTG